MIRILITGLLGTVLGFSVALTQLSAIDDESIAEAEYLPETRSPTTCVADRDLESALLMERHTTQSLLHEIDRLESKLSSSSAREPDPGSIEAPPWLALAWTELAEDDSGLDRQRQLVDHGFDAVRAEWLLKRESELKTALFSDSDGAPLDHLQAGLRTRHALRAEIGDYEYEQYLAATGQSTKIAVTEVLPGSPAEAGGLQVGDEIIDYDGKRVFNVFELSDAAGAGSSGDAVLVNVERDGAPMQFVLPRGALGISAGKPMR